MWWMVAIGMQVACLLAILSTAWFFQADREELMLLVGGFFLFEGIYFGVAVLAVNAP
jgi:hypothetical protein